MLAIPAKRYNATLSATSTTREIDALLAAPDRATWTGRRDHALLLLAIQTGLRVSELASLRCEDINLDAGWIRCQGKGRKERCTPLSRIARQVLRVWLRERGGDPAGPLFPSRNSGHLTPRRDLAPRHHPHRHRTRALPVAGRQEHHPSRRCATPPRCDYCRRTPVITAMIALWLGHEKLDSTNKYLHADMELKQRAIDRTAPPTPNPAATAPPTGCSRSSRALNYVARNSPIPTLPTRDRTPAQHSYRRTIGRQRDGPRDDRSGECFRGKGSPA